MRNVRIAASVVERQDKTYQIVNTDEVTQFFKKKHEMLINI